MTRPVGAGVVLAAGLLAACSAVQPVLPAAPNLAERLAVRVTADAMFTHLRALQGIADAHDGNRAEGTPGFDASVEYVAKTLRDKGFEVSTPEFDRLYTVSPGKPTLTVAGRNYPVDQASLLVRTPTGGITGSVVRPARPAGCAGADYSTAVPRGAIAVVDDAGCSVVDKQDAAVAGGAIALIVVSQPGRVGAAPELFSPRYYDRLRVPVAVVNSNTAAALQHTTAPVHLTLDTTTVKVTSRNVLAQTKLGSTHDVVVVGARLDSLREGPGINDNGSGVAAVLETAGQLGSVSPVTNAVRFAFWGAGDGDVNGSADYVFGLDRDQLNDIALYLDFDMLGSPNAGFFTDDGDQSGPPSREVPASDVPIGSAGIERTLAGYLNLAGKRPADMPLAAKNGYSPFLVAGIPIGGMTTGASQPKSTVQSRLWGGQAGVAFDPSYRTARDTVATINRDALAVMGSGVAFAIGTYAQSIDGVNGVPGHDKRNRRPLGR